MIAISLNMRARLQEPTISTFILVKTSNGWLKTSHPHDLVFQGETYLSDGALAKVDMPKMTSVVDRQKFSLTMIDSGMAFAADAEAGLVGSVVSVWLSCLDADGKPMLSPTDVILVYRGRIDAPTLQVATSSSGSALFTIDCASPMADLDRTRTYYASQDYIDSRYPGDTSYAQIYESSGPVSLRWGKA